MLEYQEEYEEKVEEVARVSALALTGECKPCSTVKASNLPYAAELVATSEGNGELLATFTIELSGCPLGVSCTYSKALKLEVVGSETEPEIVAEAEPMSLVKGSSKLLCGETATFSARYVVNGLIEDLMAGAVVITEHMWQAIYISPEYQR